MPADYFNIHDRGRIEVGKIADLVLIDLEKLKPNATYTDPLQLSDGTEYVWVNGVTVIENGKINEKKPGAILKNAQSL